MSDRLNIVQWREGRNGKKFTVRLGSSWVGNDGKTRLSFDALPIPVDGKVELVLEEPRERQEERPARQAAGGGRRMEDDSVPFSAEFR